MEEVTIPNEIWLKIFKMIDRPKLMELRLVCHRFYYLIEALLNKQWKEIARQAISYECLQMTMQRAYPYHLVSHWLDIHDPVLWRGTYLSYMKWQKVLVNPYSKDAIVPTSNFGSISCVRTFDKFIAIAFVNGCIASYTIDSICQPFYVAHHGRNLIQIEFWYSNGDVLLVSVGDDYALKFWDLQNKIEIATNGFFANIISSGECRQICIGYMGGILTSYDRVDSHISPGPTLDLDLRDGQQLIAHAVDGEDMTAMALAEGRTVLFQYYGKLESGKLIKLERYKKTDWIKLPENSSASLQKLTMPTCRFFFGIGENCIGSTDDFGLRWREYYMGQHFGCNVKSLALHAQILMFGLEDGSIRLLYNPRYDPLTRLENRIKHSKMIEIDTDPIIDLTVLEVDKKPCIIAATEYKVHLVNFF